jgi:hypothetical protein
MFGPHRERVRFAINKRIEGSCWITYPNGVEDIQGCVVDTGATYTIIPQRHWQPFYRPDEIIALKVTATLVKGVGGTLTSASVRCGLKLSGTDILSDIPFDLGICVVLLAFDDDANKPMKQVLFGLNGGVLEKGGLCINWKDKIACFVEALPH